MWNQHLSWVIPTLNSIIIVLLGIHVASRRRFQDRVDCQIRDLRADMKELAREMVRRHETVIARIDQIRNSEDARFEKWAEKMMTLWHREKGC